MLGGHDRGTQLMRYLASHLTRPTTRTWPPLVSKSKFWAKKQLNYGNQLLKEELYLKPGSIRSKIIKNSEKTAKSI